MIENIRDEYHKCEVQSQHNRDRNTTQAKNQNRSAATEQKYDRGRRRGQDRFIFTRGAESSPQWVGLHLINSTEPPAQRREVYYSVSTLDITDLETAD